MKTTDQTLSLAADITRIASKQTYYTIRFLADRDRAADAYRAYAYFRWVDDVLDAEPGCEWTQNLPGAESAAMRGSSPAAATQARRVFLQRQQSLLERSYRGELLYDLCPEEALLAGLVHHDLEPHSGLQCYLRNMMTVMAFDVERRGRLISQAELDAYTRWLAVAVTEALHHFIGHDDASPHTEARYLAVSAAHITHMLRDTFEDAQTGYFNIPREALGGCQVASSDVRSDLYRVWVQRRVTLARDYFRRGKAYLRQVENARCRLAGFAYIARFEWLLNTIARENYCLRPRYDERKSLQAGLQMGWLAASSMLDGARKGNPI